MLATGSVCAPRHGRVSACEHVVYRWTIRSGTNGKRQWCGERLSGVIELHCGADTSVEVSPVGFVDARERAICVCCAMTQSVQEARDDRVKYREQTLIFGSWFAIETSWLVDLCGYSWRNLGSMGTIEVPKS